MPTPLGTIEKNGEMDCFVAASSFPCTFHVRHFMCKLLLVEDNQDTIQALRQLLEVDNFQVLIAEDGQEGFDLACQNVPDIIVTDLMMPRLDGFGLVGKIREDAHLAQTPIIVISAQGRSKDTVLAAGADYYLAKPFEYIDLLAMIEASMSSVGPRVAKAGGPI